MSSHHEAHHSHQEAHQSKLEWQQPRSPTPQHENGSTLGADTNEADIEMLGMESAPIDHDWKPSTHQLLIMISLAVISFMVALDACIIVTSLNAIVLDLGGSTTEAFWVGTSYLLSTSVTMPFLATLSTIFGRPILLVFSILLFTIGSVICCAAPRMAILLGGRSVQGIGGGGIIVLSLVTFTDIVPLRYRPKWYGIVQGGWALGNCVGPIIGGVVAEKTTWRWNFYMMFPLCVFGLISIPLLLTLRPKTETLAAKLARIDWVGAALFMSSATAFLIGVSCGGTQFAWKSAHTLAPLIIGFVGLLLTSIWECFGTQEPIINCSLFRGISAFSTYVCGAIQGVILFGQLYYLPLYFLAIKAYTPINTGIALLPIACTLVPSSIVTGVLITRINKFRGSIWVGWLVLTVGCGLNMLFDQHTALGVWAISLVIVGLGHGAILNAQNFASQAICENGEEAAAAAMYGFMRHFGTALGVGLGGSTFQNVMALKLGREHIPKFIAFNAEAFIPKLHALSTSDPTRDLILDAYVFGFHGVTLAYLCMSGVAFLLSLTIRHYDMNKVIRTEQHLEDHALSRILENKSGKRAGTQTAIFR